MYIHRRIKKIARIAFATACASAAPLGTACAANTRIIRETPTTAIIAGEGDSRIEAELAAVERAAQLFPEFHQTREMECSQEYRGSSSANTAIYPAAGYLVSESSGYTYWQCVVFVAAGSAPQS